MFNCSNYLIGKQFTSWNIYKCNIIFASQAKQESVKPYFRFGTNINLFPKNQH